ncbi:hypothetical protein [Lichenibacterium ramalinae]|uniref:Uncharacterized protein n=1 Tax=Lichenibacterium ramalinae TaxID=2316527 RepID=A0A4Q2RE19_9HYPH|nr:hypothetical protein [Lichenibacterium ramalinae]RYB03577.1 hypothetical protein D3272_15595 [Lichenibacterium ramalinae]
MTDDTPPKPRRGRPRVYATPEEARLAGIARANAATRARRQARMHRTLSLTAATLAKAEALIAARGLDGITGFTDLVSALVEEETARTKSGDAGGAAP